MKVLANSEPSLGDGGGEPAFEDKAEIDQALLVALDLEMDARKPRPSRSL